jgi:hypothetical protein
MEAPLLLTVMSGAKIQFTTNTEAILHPNLVISRASQIEEFYRET